MFSPYLAPISFLTAAIPGTGGTLKERPEDFLVEEIPAYEPIGSGEHLYMLIEKRDMATLHMMRIVADHFGVKPMAVGVAGLKDKRAVTRQLVSVHIPGKKPADFPALQHEALTVHWTDLHANKLRRGHLKGNRFIIRLRGVAPAAVVHAHRVLTILAARGAPNRVGPQRFGHTMRNHEVGRALILEDHQRVLDLILGPCPEFPLVQARSRELYAAGDLEGALASMPRSAHTEVRLLRTLIRGGNAKRAVYGIEPAERSFFFTAFQSAIFNAVLAQRLSDGTFDRLVEGDLAFKHDNGAVFAIGQAELADPSVAERLSKCEISPTGPMWAPAMTAAAGITGESESAALADSGITLEQLGTYIRAARIEIEGARRPLRVPLSYPDVEGGMDEHGPYIKCRFELPRGSFATVVMDEIMKTGQSMEEDV
jgi:tRNA pseudouridine13 synthase